MVALRLHSNTVTITPPHPKKDMTSNHHVIQNFKFAFIAALEETKMVVLPRASPPGPHGVALLGLTQGTLCGPVNLTQKIALIRNQLMSNTQIQFAPPITTTTPRP